MALLQAADHAEFYAYTVMGVLGGEQSFVNVVWPEVTTDQSRAVHEWIGRVHAAVAAHASRARAGGGDRG
jgi:hypothetical protein